MGRPLGVIMRLLRCTVPLLLGMAIASPALPDITRPVDEKDEGFTPCSTAKA